MHCPAAELNLIQRDGGGTAQCSHGRMHPLAKSCRGLAQKLSSCTKISHPNVQGIVSVPAWPVLTISEESSEGRAVRGVS